MVPLWGKTSYGTGNGRVSSHCTISDPLLSLLLFLQTFYHSLLTLSCPEKENEGMEDTVWVLFGNHEKNHSWLLYPKFANCWVVKSPEIWLWVAIGGGVVEERFGEKAGVWMAWK